MAQLLEISVADLQDLASNGKSQLIDIREPNEYSIEYIEGAINIPLSSFNIEALNALAKDKNLVFHCLTGMRTKNNVEKLTEVATNMVYILSGGLNAWKSAGLPTTK